MKWVAAYIYYSPPWESLLIEGITPLSAELLNNGLVEQWFFVRYWEKGPHIRLRYNVLSEELISDITKRIDDYFKVYFDRNPSADLILQTDSPGSSNSTRVELFPNNSIQYIKYEPETERYGGAKGLLVSEEHFHLSSNIVVDCISKTSQWEYSRAVGISLQLQLAFLHSFKYRLEDAILFFYRNYLGFVQTYDPAFEGPKFEELNPEDVFSKISNKYQEIVGENKEQYQKSILQTLAGLDSKKGFREDWMNAWIRGNIDTYEKFMAIYNGGQLDVSYNMGFYDDTITILSSLIHMTNNRLGLTNQDEGLVAYILYSSLEQLNRR